MTHTINAIRFILEHVKKHGDSVDVRRASVLLDNFNEEVGGLEHVIGMLPQATVGASEAQAKTFVDSNEPSAKEPLDPTDDNN